MSVGKEKGTIERSEGLEDSLRAAVNSLQRHWPDWALRRSGMDRVVEAERQRNKEKPHS
jgi:hypothetical protein